MRGISNLECNRMQSYAVNPIQHSQLCVALGSQRVISHCHGDSGGKYEID